VDLVHVQALKEAVGENIARLDSGYKVIRYEEEEEKGNKVMKSYVVDGQHRIRVLQETFSLLGPEVDFIVTVTEKEVESEEQAIQYFNQINHAKPITYTEDDTMVANRYLTGILRAFESKMRVIRQGATRRPYLSADRLREKLIKHIHGVREYTVEEFVTYVCQVNERLLVEVRERAMTGAVGPETILAKKMVELGFALAWDEKCMWLRTLPKRALVA
jgi:hypothetical protein